MSATNQLQFDYEQFAKKHFNLGNEHISAEWLFCGQGIPILYDFYSIKEGVHKETKMTAKEIFSKIDTDPISKKSFDHFLTMLGTCMSHLSSAFLPDDGVFLSGGILRYVI